eukprot:220093_1
MSQPRVLTLIDEVVSYIDNTAGIVGKKVHAQQSFRGGLDIPTAATVRETIVLNSNIDKVWNAIKSCTFEFSSIVKSCEIQPKTASPLSVGSLRKLKYSDGTAQTIQVQEIVMSGVSRRVSYCMIESNPGVTYSSAAHSIRLLPVTHPGNQTFVEWKTKFSNDCSLEVIQDSRFKKKEAFKDLAGALK